MTLTWDWGPNEENKHTTAVAWSPHTQSWTSKTKFCPCLVKTCLGAVDEQTTRMCLLLPGDPRPSTRTGRSGKGNFSMAMMSSQRWVHLPTSHTYTESEGPIKAHWPTNLPSRGFVPIYRRRRQPRQ